MCVVNKSKDSRAHDGKGLPPSPEAATVTRLFCTFQLVFQKRSAGTPTRHGLHSSFITGREFPLCAERTQPWGDVWQGGGWEKEQKCEAVPVCVAQDYVSVSPHLAAASGRYEPGARLFVCMSIFLPLFVPFSLSLPPRLCL